MPRQNKSDTIAEIRSHKLDVLLYLGEHRLARAALSLAHFGVWSLRTGDDASGFDDTKFFLDIYGDNVVSAIALSVATNDAPAGRILAKGSFGARRNSWLLNCSQPYWSAVTFALQKLRELNEHGWERFAHNAPIIDQRETARTSLPLTSQDVARWWATRNLKQLADRPKEPLENHWRIATRVGKSPALADSATPDLSDFRLHESPPGHYYADPFLIQEAGKHWLFFEDYRYATRHGVLACAEVSQDGLVGAAQTILERPYHLSYPCLLRESGELYMVPETLGHGTVELYRCARFTGYSPASWNRTPTVVSCTCSTRAISRLRRVFGHHLAPVTAKLTEEPPCARPSRNFPGNHRRTGARVRRTGSVLTGLQFPACASLISSYYSGMPAKQMAISMDAELVSRVRKAAGRSRDGNVSAWLADAASAQLRYEEARRVLDDLITEQGPVPDAVVTEVRRQWPED